MLIFLIVFLIAILVVAFFYQRFSKVIYFIGLTDIFLRLIAFLSQLVVIKGFNLSDYLPSSLLALSGYYLNGTVLLIVKWILLVIYVIFFIYLLRDFFSKKKH